MPAESQIGVRFHSGMNSLRCAELAVAAEKSGFSSIWFAENPYERGVLPAMSACIVKTETIRVGVGVFNPFNRHPSLMAMEMGALDELSGGRTILGIGSGVPTWLNKIVRYEKPLAAVRDSVRIAGDLLAGKTVTYRGKMFSAENVTLGFKPVRDRIPIYVAAMADQALQLCGEIGDGLIVGNMCPPSYTLHAQERMKAGAEKVGRARPRTIVKYVPCSVSQSRGDAHHAVKPVIAGMLSAYWNAYKAAPAVQETIASNNGIERTDFLNALDRLAEGQKPADVLDERFVSAYAVAGTPDDCLNKCSEFVTCGVTEVVMSFIGADPEQQMSQLASVLRS